MKPKSNIQWDNHIMRKHGQGLKKQLEALGMKTSIVISCHNAFKKVKKRPIPVWQTNKPGRC